MNIDTVKVLLVEDNYDYASMLRLILAKESNTAFEVTQTQILSQALQDLEQNTYDVILLDLSLPDSEGLDTFTNLYTLAPEVPVVVLTALDDENLGILAVREGAQDYLIKHDVDGPQLARSLRYAIERQRTITKLQHLTLFDELTGLLNRRGFLSIAGRQIKIACRSKHNLLLFFADLDQLKKINDSYGHPEGDRALKSIASILQETFRSSDVIGRLGGDEFTILAIDTLDGVDAMLARLYANLERYNTGAPLVPLSISVGIARFHPESNCTLDELLVQADQALYAQKKSKQTHLLPTSL